MISYSQYRKQKKYQTFLRRINEAIENSNNSMRSQSARFAYQEDTSVFQYNIDSNMIEDSLFNKSQNFYSFPESPKLKYSKGNFFSQLSANDHHHVIQNKQTTKSEPFSSKLSSKNGMNPEFQFLLIKNPLPKDTQNSGSINTKSLMQLYPNFWAKFRSFYIFGKDFLIRPDKISKSPTFSTSEASVTGILKPGGDDRSVLRRESKEYENEDTFYEERWKQEETPFNHDLVDITREVLQVSFLVQYWI